MQKVIIIGGVAAGMSTAAKLRRNNRELEITVFEKGEHVSYGACGLPYFLAGDIPEASYLIARTKKEFRKDGINLLTGNEVTNIFPDLKKVEVRDHKTSSDKVYSYDKLVLATGAEAVKLPVEGAELSGINVLRTLKDGLEIKRQLEEPFFRNVVVVGGGYVGVEIAECLSRRGKQVTLIEMEERILLNFAKELSRLARNRLEEEGVRVKTAERVTAFSGRDRVKEVITDRGSYPADLVIVAVGVKPVNELARKAGLETGVRGAIKVDRFLQTSSPDIYAAGDCAETYHQLLKRNSYIPLGTVANKQGRLLGDNLSSDNPRPFVGSAGSSITRVFDLGLARTGLGEEEARQEGFEVETIMVKTNDHAGYMPDTNLLYIKLIFTKDEGRLLGAQLAGRGEAAKRIDTAVVCINREMTVEEMGKLDFAYSPPFAPVWDPFLIVSRIAAKKLL